MDPAAQFKSHPSSNRIMASRLFAAAILALLLAYVALDARRLDAYRDNVAIWRDLLDRFEDDAVAQGCLGEAYISHGETAQAMAHLNRSIELDPRRFMPHYNMGCLLDQVKRPAEAIAHFQQALALEPDSARAHNNLAIALLKSGRKEESIEHFEQSILQRPNDAATLLNLAEANASAGRAERALDAATRARQLAEKSGSRQMVLHIDQWFAERDLGRR
jgi:tetratricopeptide (TPR) repeat protein